MVKHMISGLGLRQNLTIIKQGKLQNLTGVHKTEDELVGDHDVIVGNFGFSMEKHTMRQLVGMGFAVINT